MNGRTELMYWMKNEKWYIIDEAHDEFIILEDAPERAKRVFKCGLNIKPESVSTGRN